eukprot:2351487-Rhodomonas_salina.2
MHGHTEDKEQELRLQPYDDSEAVGTGESDSTRPSLRPTEGNAKWDSKKWLANSKVLDVVAGALNGPSLNGIEHFRKLSDNEAEVERLLDKASLQGLKEVILKHLRELKANQFATAHEQNAKFLQDADHTMEYGNREDFDGGLSNLIGQPNDKDFVLEMYCEHNEYDYARNVKINSTNYGIETDMMQEWKGVAGMWKPKCQTFALDPNFELPAETRGFEKEKAGWAPRESICIYAFFPPSNKQHRQLESAMARECDRWWAQEDTSRWQPERAETIKRAQRAVLDANLSEPEVLAVRLWSGPAYTVYNKVLRAKAGAEKKYMTTLHALCSAIFKLSKISESQVLGRTLLHGDEVGRTESLAAPCRLCTAGCLEGQLQTPISSAEASLSGGPCRSPPTAKSRSNTCRTTVPPGACMPARKLAYLSRWSKGLKPGCCKRDQ